MTKGSKTLAAASKSAPAKSASKKSTAKSNLSTLKTAWVCGKAVFGLAACVNDPTHITCIPAGINIVKCADRLMREERERRDREEQERRELKSLPPQPIL